MFWGMMRHSRAACKYLYDWCVEKWPEVSAVRVREPKSCAEYRPHLKGRLAMSTIRVSEIFGPTIQGEGALIGQPTIFVRTGGCDYRCSWCGTMHAVDSAFRADYCR